MSLGTSVTDRGDGYCQRERMLDHWLLSVGDERGEQLHGSCCQRLRAKSIVLFQVNKARVLCITRKEYPRVGSLGASRGIGRAITTHLASLDASLVLGYTSSSKQANALAAELPRDVAVKAYVFNKVSVRSLFDTMVGGEVAAVVWWKGQVVSDVVFISMQKLV